MCVLPPHPHSCELGTQCIDLRRMEGRVNLLLATQPYWDQTQVLSIVLTVVQQSYLFVRRVKRCKSEN